jgi:hypothetical protein
MVQRVVVGLGHGSAAGEQAATVETTTRKVTKGRRDAITAIKERLLRCSEHGRRRRFKRGYLAGGCGGDAADSAVFYLACLSVCTAATTSSLLGSNQ